MKLPTAEEMRNLDHCAIETFGIPGIVLMENAGVGTVQMMERRLGSCKDSFVFILVGPGNNGGDGLVIGRHLYQRGCNPVFFFLVNPDTMKGDAATNFAIIQNLKLPYHLIDTETRVETMPVLYKQIESRGLPCYAIVDSIFGIGLCRDIGGHIQQAIDMVNKHDFAHGVPVVSVDCPSGMNANNGKTLGTCIKADYTATYGFAKPGHYLHDSCELTGELEVIDIGIPPETLQHIPVSNELIHAQAIITTLKPLKRSNSSHKGSHGHLTLLAGSAGKTGAAILAANGALRAGSGLVSLLVPERLNPVFETNLIEAMTIPLPNSSSFISESDKELIYASFKGKSAAVIGPGLGTESQTAEIVLNLYKDLSIPAVIDADALNILALNKDVIKQAGGVRIFTPHPGELSRLIDWTIADIQQNRLEATQTACELFNDENSQNIIILKGAGTVISAPGQTTLINTSGNPGMATGGMGDVLTGIIGAFLCQSISPLDSAAAAVYVHGAAADHLYENYGTGYTASEVADSVPIILKSLLS